MKRIFLYGIAGAADSYRVVSNSYIDEDNFSIRNIAGHAAWMIHKNPTIEHVYAVDQRAGLAYDYKRAWKQNSIESYAVFKDILEREGLLVI